MIYRTLVWFMLVSLVFLFGIGEVWAWKSVNSDVGSGMNIYEYRSLHIMEMLLLIAIVILIRQRVRFRLRQLAMQRKAVAGQRYWLHVSTLLIFGLAFATLGNFIAMDFVDLTHIMEPQIVLASAPMVISHFLYIRAMLIVAKSTNVQLSRNMAIFWVGLCPIIGSLLWFHTIESTADVSANIMSMFYASVLVFMAMLSIWLFMSWGLSGLIVSIGGLFLVGSSLLVSMHVYSGINDKFVLQQWIWVTYFPGHLMIALLPILALTKRARGCSYRLT